MTPRHYPVGNYLTHGLQHGLSYLRHGLAPCRDARWRKRICYKALLAFYLYGGEDTGVQGHVGIDDSHHGIIYPALAAGPGAVYVSPGLGAGAIKINGHAISPDMYIDLNLYRLIHYAVII